MKRPAVFFDRDNTLIACDGYLGDPAKVELVEGAAEAVARVRSLGFSAVVFSNQSGVARGMFSEEAVHAVNHRLDDLLLEDHSQARIDRHDFCPYHPGALVPQYKVDSDLRKPKPGMIYQAAKALNLDLERSWVVGDAPRDIAAGHAAGLRTVLLKIASLPPSPATQEGAGITPDFVATSLAEAIDFIERNPAAERNASAETEGNGQEEERPAAALQMESVGRESMAASRTNGEHASSKATAPALAVKADAKSGGVIEAAAATAVRDAWSGTAPASTAPTKPTPATSLPSTSFTSTSLTSQTPDPKEEPVKLTPRPNAKPEPVKPDPAKVDAAKVDASKAAKPEEAKKPVQGGIVVKPSIMPDKWSWAQRMKASKPTAAGASSASLIPPATTATPGPPTEESSSVEPTSRSTATHSPTLDAPTMESEPVGARQNADVVRSDPAEERFETAELQSRADVESMSEDPVISESVVKPVMSESDSDDSAATSPTSTVETLTPEVTVSSEQSRDESADEESVTPAYQPLEPTLVEEDAEAARRRAREAVIEEDEAQVASSQAKFNTRSEAESSPVSLAEEVPTPEKVIAESVVDSTATVRGEETPETPTETSRDAATFTPHRYDQPTYVPTTYVAPTQTTAPPPVEVDLGRVEDLLSQVLVELRRREEQASLDFSVSKLLAGITQVLALAAMFFAYLNRDTQSLQSTLLLALTLQTLTISLLIMGKQK